MTSRPTDFEQTLQDRLDFDTWAGLMSTTENRPDSLGGTAAPPAHVHEGSVKQGSQWSWAERVTAEAVVAMLSWGVAGLGLAVIGWFHWWSVFPLAISSWLILRRFLPRPAKSADGWWVAALLVVIALGVLNGMHPGEHLLTGRDSGTYLATAGWLAESGTLYVDARAGPLGEYDDFEFAVPGFYDRRADGLLEPQFMHTYPAMLGSLIDVGGLSLALLLNPAIGSLMLLALFALARRFMRPWAALVTIGIVGLSMVFLYYSRAPFTEPLMALFVVAGIWMLGVAEDQNDRTTGLLAGLLVGAATIVRLDGIVLLLPAAAYMLIRSASAPELAQVMRRARLGMNAAAAVGLTESLLISPAYILERSRFVVPVLAALLVLFVGHDLIGKRLGMIAMVLRNQKRIVYALVLALAVTLLAYGWFVRPLISEAPGSPYGLAAIQESEGLPTEDDRSYAESSVRWLTWYQGAGFVVLALVGAAAMVHREVFSTSERPGWLVPGVLLTFAVLYLWRPSVNPDHIWAMRRYLTVVIPLGALAAGVALDATVTRVAGRLKGRAPIWMLGGALSVALLVPPIVTTAPVWDVHELSGLSADFEQLCDWVGETGHVLILDDGSGVLGNRLTQSFRSFCGVPAAWNNNEVDGTQLAEIKRQIEAEGGTLMTITPGGDESGQVFLEGPYEILELTLSHPPQKPSFIGTSITAHSTIPAS